MAVPDLSRLAARLGYAFKNTKLMKQALTHCSASSVNNERFEFLGDSILSFVIAAALFRAFPDEAEGHLSRLRAYLVKGDMLAEIAQEIELGQFLILGQGELRSGGHRRASILADTLEALFAAIYLDGGLEAAQQVILALYESRLAEPGIIQNTKDAKTRLQEHLQARGLALPVYELQEVAGSEHEQHFKVTCKLMKFNHETEGTGPTRRKAEQQAAEAMLKKL